MGTLGEVGGAEVLTPGADRLPVSVVVPTVGRADLLRTCLASVLACRPGPDEVVVVDQSGHDVAGAIAAELADPRIRVVTGPARGIAKATNLGFASARHGIVFVTHDDCTVATRLGGGGPPTLLRHPARHLTGRVLPPDGSGYVPSTIVSRGASRLHRVGDERCPLTRPTWPSDRNALLAFGGFDERRGLELAAEDNDLCFRWLCAGRQLRFEPELVVWHHDWRSPAELVRTHITYAHGQGAFYAKHLRAGERRILPLLRWDLSHGIDAVAVGVLKRRPRWQDPYREMVVGLLWGIATNLPEANRLARQAPRQPDDSP